MGSPFSSLASTLMGAIDSLAGETITYTRPSTAESIPLTATPGQTDHEDFDASGFPVSVRSKDWLFDAAVLKLDGLNVTEPQRDDEIRWTDGNAAVHVYRVLPFGSGQREWRFSDPAETRLRIHSKKVDTE